MNRRSCGQDFIGFPSGLLGDVPLRIPVINDAEDWIALEKPVGVGVRQHPWDVSVPDMDSALNSQLKANKPELLRHEAVFFGSVYYLEPEVSGVSVFAKNREGLNRLRNQLGSEELQFRFLFVTRGGLAAEAHEFTADAPLLIHNTKPKMIPSTAKGKKARTQFRLLFESRLGWALWEARTSYIRPHQVRVHAATHGFPIMGDETYSGPKAPPLSDFLSKKSTSAVFCPVFNGIALHLFKVIIPMSDLKTGTIELFAEPSKYFQLMLQRMQLVEAAKIVLQAKNKI